jgi:hypothetical protein
MPGGRGQATVVTLLVATGTAGVVASAAVASGRPILASRWSLLAELGAWTLAWAVGVGAALRLPPRVSVSVVIVFGVALRLAALAGPPTTSDDLYRYSWDGRVQAAGIDPYAHPPTSPALAELRDPWLWPDSGGCASLHRPPGCTRINRPGQRTIYPPGAEAWFAAVYRATGIGARHKAWQVAGLLTELGVLALLPLALRRWGRDPRWVALYALSPAPVLELVNNGHVDGLAILAIVAALAVMFSAGDQDRPGADIAAGALIGAAALVKLYPAILILVLVGAGRPHHWRAAVRAGVTATILVALAYLPHVLAVGPKVLGYLPGYLKEEHYSGGGRFLIAGALRIPPHLAGPASAAAVAAVAVWVAVRRPPAPDAAALLLGAVFLATSPVQPWYAVALLAVATVAARPSWVLVVIAAYPYFFAVILANAHAVGIGQFCYTAAWISVVGAAAARARRGRVTLGSVIGHGPDRGAPVGDRLGHPCDRAARPVDLSGPPPVRGSSPPRGAQRPGPRHVAPRGPADLHDRDDGDRRLAPAVPGRATDTRRLPPSGP